VEDNSLGFDPQTAMQRGRLGLPGMRERAEMLGGSLEVESSPEGGTTLFVEVPHVHSHPDR
jgi:signal transduction histidine kinase